jgi:hypothetical protein
VPQTLNRFSFVQEQLGEQQATLQELQHWARLQEQKYLDRSQLLGSKTQRRRDQITNVKVAVRAKFVSGKLSIPIPGTVVCSNQGQRMFVKWKEHSGGSFWRS